jgi:hypothetical protein
MQKIASTLLLLGGAVLLVTWFVSPAASVQKQSSVTSPTPIDRVGPVLAEVDAEVARLRDRLPSPESYPPPSRDPFNFGRLPEVPNARPAIVEPAPALVVAPPTPALPSLVAIVSDIVDGADVRSAAISQDDEVQIVKVGDVVGALVVRGITADALQLVDEKTGASFRITLDRR